MRIVHPNKIQTQTIRLIGAIKTFIFPSKRTVYINRDNNNNHNNNLLNVVSGSTHTIAQFKKPISRRKTKKTARRNNRLKNGITRSAHENKSLYTRSAWEVHPRRVMYTLAVSHCLEDSQTISSTQRADSNFVSIRARARRN